MPSKYYRRSDIIDGKYYKVPNYIKANFDGIAYKELVYQDGDRLDLIASNIYGNPSHWRAIALFNDITDMFEPQPGDIIRLPTKIEEVLNRI